MIFTYWHVLISFIIFIIVGYLEIVVAENVTDMEYNKHPLFDYLHKSVPEISEKIPSTIVIMLMIYTVIRFYNKPEILTLYFISSSVIFLGRLSTFTITQTPPVMLESDINRETKCKKTLFHTFGVSFKNTDQICIDNMFSGHAVNSIVPMMMILLYSNYKYEKIAISIIALINSFFVIISRLHYSSDVIVSIFLSITTPLAIKYIFRNKLSVCKK